ncbi:hypothetical protein MBORA_18030 [Methanobrevibacter oralis]|uniref:Uncharacterized protein n=1 Tax=Methanobrevibacter oralis TaxID=66851 RepID=A0A162FBC6_METOA|nr:hypothetical protein MBORA_18030 [Methanobrevibacter oralis]
MILLEIKSLSDNVSVYIASVTPEEIIIIVLLKILTLLDNFLFILWVDGLTEGALIA